MTSLSKIYTRYHRDTGGARKRWEAAINFLERLKSDPIFRTKSQLYGKKEKRMLSSCKVAKHRINRPMDDLDYNLELTSAELVSITREFIQQTNDFMNCALEDAKIKHGDVDEVVFI